MSINWRLVPVEPTREMVEAYLKGTTAGFYSARTDWANMLAAAPAPDGLADLIEWLYKEAEGHGQSTHSKEMLLKAAYLLSSGNT